MPRRAHVTHIQTGSERAAGENGKAFDQWSADRAAEAREATAEYERNRKARGDKTYGPDAPDGWQPKKWYQRR